jgi:ectoine hydroxylase-related dioxygenase (phytanoyl-CoA dioxygenase family)
MTFTTTPPIDITDSDVAEYHERGYWVSPKLLSDDQIAMLRDELARVLLRNERDTDNWSWSAPPDWSQYAPTQVRQVTNAWWANFAIRKAVLNPVIGYIGSRFMNTPEVRLWHDQVIYKPPSAGDTDKAGNVGWHQDYAHWQCCSTSNMCTAWVALQDTDLSNGGMRTIVGSHKTGMAEDAYTFGEKDLDALQARFSKGRQWIDEPCIIKAGHASFHHALTFHGSGPNLSDQPRWNFIVHMMPQDCVLTTTSKARHHLCATLLGPWAKEGTPFAGPLFPRLWPVDPSFPLDR